MAGKFDFQHNNLVAVGGAVLLSLAAMFSALRSIPYADRDQTNADLSDVHSQLKEQWQKQSDDEDKDQKRADQMKKDEQQENERLEAEIERLQDKYEALLSDENELRGETKRK